MIKFIVMALMLTLALNAEWVTQCDEDAECKQVWIAE